MELIGFVGLGTIGGVVARNIQKGGYPMMVHDIRPEAAQPFVGGGSQLAGSPADVARHCRIVFTSLSRSAGSRASRSWLHGAFAGRP
jgi:3-hydroxyisobutyrate dehydrogenase